ncbi:hypothetical protein KQX54_001530 [Cotesia glomerata]|uniref:EB domain-containing protein n=1 Tax=Cotesia glomerata TaxID=32391 RepID=A0AAV7IB30_COTGL|nr:hypothetical protein KQX54_001530 [Cotesia glomerata]
MQRQNAAIILVSIALIFSVNAEDKSEILTDCVPFGEVCHLHRPCCGNYKCDLTDTFGRFECQEKVKLGDTCRNTDDCVDIVHSVCTKKKCQCRQNLLGTSCQADYDCQYIPNAICIDKICVCKPNTFALTPSACTHLLNTSCSSSADCDVEASHCFENKCQCKPEWVALTDMTCVEHSAVYDCKEDFECGETWRTRCHQNKCVCNANHIAVSELTCLPILDGTCWRDDQCMTKNSHCDGSWCQCKPGFVSVAKNMCVLS